MDRQGWAAALSVLAAAAAVLLLEAPLLALPGNHLRSYDEGIALTSALRQVQGEVPWRDFEPVYGPLEPALLALRPDGPEALDLRRLRGLAAAVAAAGALAAAWTTGARGAALLAALGALAAATPQTQPALGPLALSVPALAAAARRSGRARAADLAAAGALVGLAGLLRHEHGAVGALAALAAVGLAPRAATDPARARDAGWVLLGGAPALAVVAALAATAPGRVLEHQRHNREALPFRSLPFPGADDPLLALLAWLPLLALGAAAVTLALQARRAGQGPPRSPTSTATAVHLGALVLGLLPYALWRPDRAHAHPAALFAAALLAALVGPREARLPPAAGRATLTAGVAALAAALGARLAPVLDAAADPRHAPASLRGLTGLRLAPAEERALADAVAAVRAALRPGQPLLVVCAGHARVHGNDALLYALVGAPVATRWHCFVPGVTTTPAVQAAIVAELDARDPLVVVALDTWRPEPNRSLEPGARLLDEVLHARYAPALHLPAGYLVLRRRARRGGRRYRPERPRPGSL